MAVSTQNAPTSESYQYRSLGVNSEDSSITSSNLLGTLALASVTGLVIWLVLDR